MEIHHDIICGFLEMLLINMQKLRGREHLTSSLYTFSDEFLGADIEIIHLGCMLTVFLPSPSVPHSHPNSNLYDPNYFLLTVLIPTMTFSEGNMTNC